MWYNTVTLFRFHQFYGYSFVCVLVRVHLVPYDFIRCRLCDHHNKDTQRFHHNSLLWYPFIGTVGFSLSIFLLRFIKLLCVSLLHSILVLTSIPCCEYITVCLTIHLFQGHLSYLQILVYMNKVTMNTAYRFCIYSFQFSGMNA